MDYILSGDPLHVENILKENARRVELGWVKFTPATLDDKTSYRTEDTKEVLAADSKTAVVADTKTAAAVKAKKTVKTS